MTAFVGFMEVAFYFSCKGGPPEGLPLQPDGSYNARMLQVPASGEVVRLVENTFVVVKVVWCCLGPGELPQAQVTLR